MVEHPNSSYVEINFGSTNLAFMEERFAKKQIGDKQSTACTSTRDPSFMISIVCSNISFVIPAAISAGAIIVKNSETNLLGTFAQIKDINGILIELCEPSHLIK